MIQEPSHALLLGLALFTSCAGKQGTVTVTIAVPTGDDPFLVDSAEETMTPAPADAPMRWGFYTNVEPRDDYELVWNEASGDCRWAPGEWSGWSPTSKRENAARVVVRAGYITYFTALRCPFLTLDEDGGTSDAGPADAAIDAAAP